MISLTRSLARNLRAVFRRLVPRRGGHGSPPLVELIANKDGLRARLATGEVAAEFHQTGALNTDTILLTLEALAECEGRDDSEVAIETIVGGRIEMRWEAKGIPQQRDYTTVVCERLFPEPAETTVPNEPGLLVALEQAVETACKEVARYTLNRIMLRGKSGEVIATDGKQLLIQGGYLFPWAEDVLVPTTPVFGCKELEAGRMVRVGRTDEHVMLSIGEWTFWLTIAPDGRFPDVAAVMPKGQGSILQLDPADLDFLVRSLPSLPGAEDDNAPVTVDLNGEAAVRARAEGQTRSTEVVLSRSTVEGSPVRFSTDRGYLLRAAELGFPSLRAFGPEKPVLCKDGRRTYMWMTLGGAGLPPDADAMRLDTAAERTPRKKGATKARKAKARSEVEVVPAATGTSEVRETPAPKGVKSGAGTAGLAEEAREVQRLLRETMARTRKLLAAIRVHLRQHRLVRSTLASLRQLQHVG
jgi:hypothetical protein